MMANYEEAGVKLTNTQLNKLKSAAKSKNETILKTSMKNLQNDELIHELFLTTRQRTKIRNAFANNMSINIKLGKAQLSKIIKSGEFLGKTLGNKMGNSNKDNTNRPHC